MACFSTWRPLRTGPDFLCQICQMFTLLTRIAETMWFWNILDTWCHLIHLGGGGTKIHVAQGSSCMSISLAPYELYYRPQLKTTSQDRILPSPVLVMSCLFGTRHFFSGSMWKPGPGGWGQNHAIRFWKAVSWPSQRCRFCLQRETGCWCKFGDGFVLLSRENMVFFGNSNIIFENAISK